MRSKKSLVMLVLDGLLINMSVLLSLFIRFEGRIYSEQFIEYLTLYREHFVYITMIKLITFIAFGLYRSQWRYASIEELLKIVMTNVIANGIIIIYSFMKLTFFPRSIYALVLILDIVLIGASRLGLRILARASLNTHKQPIQKRIMIIGAGDAGAMVIREYKNHKGLDSRPVAIIDDDSEKIGKTINRVPIVGNRQEIPKYVDKLKIDEIVIAMPSASKKDIGQIASIAKTTKVKLKILPGIYELIDDKVSISQIRDVEIEDLLGRDEVEINLKDISSYLKDKTVLVTGGGGSIGSELCRQIARFKPRKLIILDIYENTAYDIQNELKTSYKDLDLKVLIGSIRDRKRLDEIMEREGPEVVFHAAAHKHVPLMEDSPREAIKNNVFGTLNLAQAADKYGVERFVMISTDKAVNPTNIMGASKRICEMIIQGIDRKSETDYVAVRFGNVLDSNGSVIPLFKRQIAQGGPVTVTHKDVIRYFMTIPEAVQLVIQAGSMARGGEIFVLDMGEPVKIMDLAEDLIRLSGFKPNVDMKIEVVGLRPGEKLYEELLLDEEGIDNTEHEKIFIGQPLNGDYEGLLRSLQAMKTVIEDGTEEELREKIQIIVPNYSWNRYKEDKME